MKSDLKTVFIASCVCLSLIFIYDRYHVHTVKLVEEQYARTANFAEPVNQDNQIAKQSLFSNSDIFIEAADYARNSVVSIKAVQIKGRSWEKDKYTRSNGSGVIISSDGYIVTNYHVVEDADIIECISEDRREYNAEVIGFDRSTDIALLKIEANSLDFLQFGDSDALNVGEWVLAIGNPFKLQSSVTAGIVSAKARNINIFNRQGIESFIQTDAAINPGNSGGALINTNGYLVGINTAILTYSGKYEGFSFAIPSSIVSKVVKDIKQYGAVQRAWLGVSVVDINFDMAQSKGLDFVGGAMIDLVEKESAAKKAGLRSEDVIVSINGKQTSSVSQFLEIISQFRPGDSVVVDYYRGNKSYSATAVLQNQINSTDFIAVRKDKLLKDLGFELRELDSGERSRLSTEGVMVVSIIRDSKISDTNMDPNYIITSVNGAKIRNVDELIAQFKSIKGKVELKGFYENWPGNYPYVFYLK